MRGSFVRPAAPEIVGVPSLGTDTPILACDTFKTRQIGKYPPDRLWSSAYHVHYACSAAGSRRISEFPKAASCRFRHPISGSRTA
jgi:hypothetical protein